MRIPSLISRFPSRLAATAALTLLAASAIAQTPPTQQVPGVYHQRLGALHVTALFDGVVPLPRSLMHGIDATALQTLLTPRYVPETSAGLQTAVNAYLIQDGNTVTLVDTGAAQCFGPTLGQMLTHLRSAGYTPEQVDHVLLTHAHPDHLCGLLDAQAKPAFPNATVWLARAEADYWLDPQTPVRTHAPADQQALFTMARNAVAPYRAAQRLRLFNVGDALPGNVTGLDTHGHTPGHTSFLFKASQEQKLLIWGDIMHYHAVQFARPEVSVEFDINHEQAVAARRRLLADTADNGWWLAGAHLPFPGLGHVRRDGQAYAWVPTEFSPLPAQP